MAKILGVRQTRTAALRLQYRYVKSRKRKPYMVWIKRRSKNRYVVFVREYK